MEGEPRPTSRYGGTPAPCDDPAPCEVGPRTGLRIRTRLAPSGIDGAGLGRFADEAVAEGAVIRQQARANHFWQPTDGLTDAGVGWGQTLGSGNLLAFTSAAALREAFPLAADLRMLADFAYCAAEHPGTVLLDAPPTMARAPPPPDSEP